MSEQDNLPAILVINSGSTSLKFALYQRTTDQLRLVARGDFSGMPATGQLRLNNASNELIYQHSYSPRDLLDHERALTDLLTSLKTYFPLLSINYAGHRIVLGGDKYRNASKLDTEVLEYLESLTVLEPTHQHFEIKGAKALLKVFPAIQQSASFDTSFHRTMPEIAEFYPVAPAITEKGVRHWGFHGISYSYINLQMAKIMPQANKVIVAHLGGGASLCAIRDGKSIDTSMQFGAITGVPMATRSGDFPVDAVFYLLKQGFYSLEQLESELEKHSGLFGASLGLSDSMQKLEQSSEPQAQKALAYFEYAVLKYIGAYCAALEGCDALVFTAGIGENDASFRSRLLSKLAWLGIKIDQQANQIAIGGHNATKISSQDSKIAVYVIPTNEELMIAQNVVELFGL